MKRVLLTAMVLGGLGWLMPESKSVLSQDADKALTTVSPDQLQKLLDASGRAYTKQDGNFNLRLGNYNVILQSYYQGKALVAGCNGFKKVSLERINQWNDEQALSRAILRKEESRLEADLDCELGVTVKTLDLFLERFKASLAKFDTFLGGVKQGTGPLNVVDVVSQAFPAKAAEPKSRWDIEWDLVPAGNPKGIIHLLRIISAKFSFKDPAGKWKSVIVARDLQLVEAFSPYDDLRIAFLDVALAGRADKSVAIDENLRGPNRVAPSQTLQSSKNPELTKGKKPKLSVIKEVHDDGVRWLQGHVNPKTGENHQGYRGEKLIVWSAFQAVNYVYMVEYCFTDDGRIVCRLGFTGHNFYNRGKGAQGSVDGDVHLHIGCWRMDVDLSWSDPGNGGGGPTKNDYRLIRRYFDETANRFKIDDKPFGDKGFKAHEGKTLWKADEFTILRVQSTEAKNGHQRPIAYDLVPLRYGAVPRFKNDKMVGLPVAGDLKVLGLLSSDFVNYDFWITRTPPQATDYHKVPALAAGGLPLVGERATVWYSAPALHSPRGEDFGPSGTERVKGVALTTWIEFTLRPRDVFDGTPLYP